MKSLLVILLEDNVLDAELNQVELQQHLAEYKCTFKCVTNKTEYRHILEEIKPDLVLSDYNIPSYSGLEALRDFKTKFPFTPFIFVTGTQQEEVAAQAIKEGAWDFVVKDRLSRLPLAVQNALKLRDEQLKNSRIQESVAKSELWFRSLFNTANDAILMMTDFKFIDCNPAAEKMFGYPKEEFLKQTPATLSPLFQASGRSSEEASIEIVKNVMGGQSQFFEWLHMRSDGTVFDAEVALNHLELEGEVFVQAVVRDITERKNTLVALGASEKRFRNLVQQSPMAVIEWDTRLNVMEWNEAAEEIFGYNRSEVLGRSAYGLILEEEQNAQIEEVLESLIRQQGGSKNTNNNITKKKEVITCEWYNRPLTDEKGEIIGIVSMVQDITDKIKAESALKESELKFRQIIHSSPMGIYVYEVNSSDQLILADTNPVADSMVGIDGSELIGKPIEEIFPAMVTGNLPKHFLAAALYGTPWFTEDISFSGGKTSRSFQIYAFQSGKNRVAVMFMDITQRRQIEAAIKTKNEELLKINAELDRFVYSASHDLRAPIASLLGLVEVARLEKDSTGVNRLLDMQKRSLLKLDNFIHDIVNYSRNSRLELEIEPIEFTTMIEGIFEHLYFMDQFSHVDRRVNVPTKLEFSSDPKRISIILNNLISNALKYTDINKESPYVEVRVEKNESGITLCVADNGEGIDEEHHVKIFDMFYRATLNSSGSGIGLYIVNEIVQKMKGTITIESKKGEGSKFFVTLPNLNRQQLDQ